MICALRVQRACKWCKRFFFHEKFFSDLINECQCIWRVMSSYQRVMSIYHYSSLNSAWKSTNTTSWLRIFVDRLNIVYSKREDVVVEKQKKRRLCERLNERNCWFISMMMIRFKSVYCMWSLLLNDDTSSWSSYLLSDLYVESVVHVTHANLMRSGYLSIYLVRLVKPFGQTLGPL
jgi:hypothetical protein